MAVFGPMAELFAPGRQHTEEERRRLALTREDAGDADPGRGPIDLRSGRVTIRVPRAGTRGDADGRPEHSRGDGAERPGGGDGTGQPEEAHGDGDGRAGG